MRIFQWQTPCIVLLFCYICDDNEFINQLKAKSMRKILVLMLAMLIPFGIACGQNKKKEALRKMKQTTTTTTTQPEDNSVEESSADITARHLRDVLYKSKWRGYPTRYENDHYYFYDTDTCSYKVAGSQRWKKALWSVSDDRYVTITPLNGDAVKRFEVTKYYFIPSYLQLHEVGSSVTFTLWAEFENHKYGMLALYLKAPLWLPNFYTLSYSQLKQYVDEKLYPDAYSYGETSLSFPFYLTINGIRWGSVNLYYSGSYKNIWWQSEQITGSRANTEMQLIESKLRSEGYAVTHKSGSERDLQIQDGDHRIEIRKGKLTHGYCLVVDITIL